MIRSCDDSDTPRLLEIINSAAIAYRGTIPEDCWHEPYMSADEIQSEIDDGVVFFGYRDDRGLVGVMGTQDIEGVTLIRHAYVVPDAQGGGVGHALLAHLLTAASRPVLVGTWTSAVWAIRFYERHGFTSTEPAETHRLLDKYWSVPSRQMEVSTVLVGPGAMAPHASSDSVVLKKLDELEREQQRIHDLESKLERIRARRFAGPGSFVVFGGLGFYLMGDAILALVPGSAGFIWAVSFVILYLVAIAWNELNIRAAEPRVREELAALEDPIH